MRDMHNLHIEQDEEAQLKNIWNSVILGKNKKRKRGEIELEE